jgi:hypothetical protein
MQEQTLPFFLPYQIRPNFDRASFAPAAGAWFDMNRHQREAPGMIPSQLPFLAGALGGWLLLGLKILAAGGFIVAADLLILYAS